MEICFAAGTLVHTKEGLKPIEEICIGDWVLSYPDDQTPPPRMRKEDEYTYRQVTRTLIHEGKPICEVTTINFASNAKEIVKVTPEHPFFVKHKGWTPASGMNFRSVLFAANFGNLVVAEVVNNDEKARVYNFEVEDFHTYYVGKLGAWVHNTCGDSKQLPFNLMLDTATQACRSALR